ncbi:MAG: site-specific DNA-methyltransferase [Actinobacteria bacterium]|nr:site-specific DNA-methyltransferase [Actinomycetota bacterium]
MKKLTAADPETMSPDLVVENIERLKALFPELLTEGPDGAAVNVDVLKQLVGDKTVSDTDEKYGLNWHGKRRARQLALTPSTGTLRPAPEDSVDWDTTQNLMIEGDNLEVLKLLQKSYAGKVKLIYIDPPYNTGKDFVYPDNFKDNIRNYMELTGQVEGGTKISSNTEASGRFHTDWLNMMYPRLKLARSLLREDGAVFVSLDDGEIAHLRTTMDDIFGAENFVANVIWEKKFAPQNDEKYFSERHDFIVVFAKNKFSWNRNLLARGGDALARYKNPDNDPRGAWASSDLLRMEHRDNCVYTIVGPTGTRWTPDSGTSWRHPEDEMRELIRVGQVWFGADGGSKPRRKRYLSAVSEGVVPETIWFHKDCGHNQEATQEVKSLFADAGVPFSNPKPTRLVKRMLDIGTSSSGQDIVLDFFAGSGTTGHAAMAQNSNDGGNRRFILVQLPEPLDSEVKEQRLAAECCDNLGKPRNIAELTKERLRRAAKKIKEENPSFAGDRGFRVFKLDSSNIHEWEPDRDDLDQTLLDSIDHLKADRTEQDILYELLLKLGLDLCVPIETRTVVGKAVHSIGGGVLLACLATQITQEEVEPLAQDIVDWHKELAPAGDTTCVFRDSAFADDVAKTNLAAILEQHDLKNVRSL